MPDLANLSLSSSLSLARCSTLKSLPPPPPPLPSLQSDDLLRHSDFRAGDEEEEETAYNVNSVGVVRRSKKGHSGKFVEDYVREMDMGASTSRSFLPFLVGAKKLVACLVCHGFINPGEEVLCSIRDCKGAYHSMCVKEGLGISNLTKFKCPQHACFICKQRFQWRCVCCEMASHDKCAPWPDKVIHLINQPGRAVCWRHPTEWRFDKKHMVPTKDMEEVFCRLPLPYTDEEFQIDLTWKGLKENKLEPPRYVHIRRNVYLVKKKRDSTDTDVGCTTCSSTCCEDCVCRVQCISCSRACRCSENCNNRPFRKEKKIKIVKTEFCGWGVEAAEPLNKGDFVIEYIGEVIDDALCEERLWDMKYKGVENFYMCEIRKDFTIDATFKGNASRFLNHSCNPNCFLEKWQVEGETRVGVFAARSINVGESLTYDYRFVQFGPEVKCYCGASNCQGYLGNGTKRKIGKLSICWGAKKRRSPKVYLANNHIILLGDLLMAD